MVATNYCLEVIVVDQIELYTTTFVGDDGNTKYVKLDVMLNILEEEIILDRDNNLPKIKFTFNDINLRVRCRVGDTVLRDASCNLDYITGAMRCIGTAMRLKHLCIPINVPSYIGGYFVVIDYT